MTTASIITAVLVLAVWAFAWSLCRTAAEADRAMRERVRNERERG
jgi:hypothetical protein